MSNFKLGVDVIGAHNLLPKDGQGSSNAFVELSFDGLKQRTTIKEKQLNPIWNESFYFNVSDLSDFQYLILDAYVYSRVRATSSKSSTRTRSFLGKVSLPGSSFVQDYSNAVVIHHRLEKHRTFSRVTGDLGLKVYIIGDPSILVSTPIAAVDPHANAEVGTRLPSFHHSSNRDHEHGEKTPSSSSIPIAAVESLIADTALQNQGYSNPPVANNSSTISNAEIGTGHTSPDHEDNASTSSKYSLVADNASTSRKSSSVADNASTSSKYSSVADNASTSSKSSPVAEIRSLAIANKDTTLARGGSNPRTATVEAGVGTRDTLIHRSIPSHDPGDKEESASVPVGLMHFLYVRIVKARDLPGDASPFVEATIGKYKGMTKHFDKETNPEWHQVFSFSRVQLQASVLKVVVKEKDKNCVVGSLLFDTSEIPSSPSDSDTASSLAPQWYRLQDKDNGGYEVRGELLLSVWFGTQTDEAFSDAGNSNAASVVDSTPLASTVRGPNRYLAPRLWYVRVNVIEVQDLRFTNENRLPDAYVKVSIGNQVLSTKTIQSRKRTLLWNEELLFVTAEPFENDLLVAFVDHAGPNKDEVVGRAVISLSNVERRSNRQIGRSRWYRIENHPLIEGELSSLIHAQIYLEGGYCVSYGSPLYNCDLRPTAKQLWRPAIGVVELGIMDTEGLHPMKTSDGRGTTDSYCVAKYGHKWVRTRIHFDNLCPKYNETHSWAVYDTATVLTVCVFHCSQLGQRDSSNGGKDLEMGKIRIRISTLEPGRRYTESYPLLVVQPNGVNKLGELNLTIQFSCRSLLNMLWLYSQPLMPKMHYSSPIPVKQLDMLNAEAINLVAERFSKAEPPLKKEVVKYMSDGDSCFWSMRRSKATFFRVTMVLSGLFPLVYWFKDIYMWKNPIMTVLAHALFLVLVTSPGFILPATFVYMFLIGIWNFCFVPRDHRLIDTKLTQPVVVDPDEFEEELDTFPTSQSRKVLMKRYDRLRGLASRVQKVVGDVAIVGERIQMLLSWRDSSATAIFVTFCLVVALVLYVTPFEVVAGSALFVMVLPGRLRYRLPSVLAPLTNFFSRLPDKTDILL